MLYGRDTSGNSARPLASRTDMDGKEFIYARAHGALTALTPYLAYVTYDGWRTAALFDTGYASTSAASHPQYVAFVPPAAISSDTDGWGQVGGPCEDVIFPSNSVTAGNRFIWHDATVTGTAGATNTAVMVAVYGVCMSTASSGAYDTMLLGSNHWMFGVT